MDEVVDHRRVARLHDPGELADDIRGLGLGRLEMAIALAQVLGLALGDGAGHAGRGLGQGPVAIRLDEPAEALRRIVQQVFEPRVGRLGDLRPAHLIADHLPRLALQPTADAQRDRGRHDVLGLVPGDDRVLGILGVEHGAAGATGDDDRTARGADLEGRAAISARERGDRGRRWRLQRHPSNSRSPRSRSAASSTTSPRYRRGGSSL